jgi:hypothetical protein
MLVTPGSKWSMTVFWGMMLAWIIPLVVLMILGFVLAVMGGIGAASLKP